MHGAPDEGGGVLRFELERDTVLRRPGRPPPTAVEKDPSYGVCLAHVRVQCDRPLGCGLGERDRVILQFNTRVMARENEVGRGQARIRLGVARVFVDRCLVELDAAARRFVVFVRRMGPVCTVP